MLLLLCSVSLLTVSAEPQCDASRISSATSNSDIVQTCNTDNCGITLAGEAQKVTLDVLCPYAAVSCLSSGYDHEIEINCYNCDISDRCTNAHLGTQLTYNDTKTSTKYSSLSNCDCTAITRCQNNITSNYCLNTYDIELDFKSTDTEKQYIECQRACYQNDDCTYGVYYSSEWSQCRFINGGCYYSEFINAAGSYYFVSKGCTSFSNGSFRAISFPESTTIAPTKKKKKGINSALTASGSAVFMLFFVVLLLGRRIFGGRCRRALRRRNQQNQTQQTGTARNANVNQNAQNPNNQIQHNPTYPAAAVQQQQSYSDGQQVILPNGQIAIVRTAPHQQVMQMNQSPYNPAMQYASAPVQPPAHVQQQGEQHPYTLQ